MTAHLRERALLPDGVRDDVQVEIGGSRSMGADVVGDFVELSGVAEADNSGDTRSTGYPRSDPEHRHRGEDPEIAHDPTESIGTVLG